jgi:serine/threonine-protein kinase
MTSVEPAAWSPRNEAASSTGKKPIADALAWLWRLGRNSTRVTRQTGSGARRDAPRSEEEPRSQAPSAADPRYVDLGEIDRGGMGSVRLVRDTLLRRELAMKMLTQELASETRYVDQFIAEAQITAQLVHPNIVPVHDLGVDANGTAYFTMKAVRGQSLYYWLNDLRRRPGSPERLGEGLEIFLKVCDAVSFAHSRDVVHRDLKTDNVMVGEHGEVYVLDWGLALLLDRGVETRGVETIARKRPSSSKASPLGTVAYMSPEAARGEAATCDERTDVFGLGAILYEIVTGAPPYRGLGLSALLERAKLGDYPPPEQVLGGIGVSKRILRIVRKAMACSREDRYASAAELKVAVQRFLRGGLYLPRQAFAPGAPILREGDPADAAYLVVHGHCEMYRSVDGEKQVVRRLGPGDVFGEMALVPSACRSASAESVDAVDAVTVLVVERSTLEEELGAETWVWAVLQALSRRVAELELAWRTGPAP